VSHTIVPRNVPNDIPNLFVVHKLLNFSKLSHMFLMLFPKFPSVPHVCSLNPFLRFGEMFLNVVFKFPMCLSCVVYIHPIGFAKCSLCCSHSSHVSLLLFLSLTFYNIIKVHIIIFWDKFCPIFGPKKIRKFWDFFNECEFD
jgi:hypothetical protein